MTTRAHSAKETLTLLQVYPEHIERASDPHYHLFTAARNRLKKAGLLKCWIDNEDCDTTHPIELHHNDIEFALSNLVDLDRFNHFHAAMHDMVHAASDDEFQAYVESEGNLLPLCLRGDAPVLMADGSERPISAIRLGDGVIGGDGQPHRVTGCLSRDYVGELVQVSDRLWTTPEHHILTPHGWHEAGRLLTHDAVAVLMPQMIGVSRVQSQVLGSVIRLDAIDMMDTLSREQFTSKSLLHHPPMLHNRALVGAVPGPSTAIATARYTDAKQTAPPWEVPLSQPIHAADIRTEDALTAAYLPGRDDNLLSTRNTGDRNTLTPSCLTLKSATTGIRAGGVAGGEVPQNDVCTSAVDTRFLDSSAALPACAWWRPVGDLQRFDFHDSVYDIEVEGCHSFVADNVVVHNCKLHHTGVLGIHVIHYPAWRLQAYIKAGVPRPERKAS